MKKFFLAGAVVLSVMALATTSNKQKTHSVLSGSYMVSYNDTIPKRYDQETVAGYNTPKRLPSVQSGQLN